MKNNKITETDWVSLVVTIVIIIIIIYIIFMVLPVTFINLTVIKYGNIIHNSDCISDLFLLFELFIY